MVFAHLRPGRTRRTATAFIICCAVMAGIICLPLPLRAQQSEETQAETQQPEYNAALRTWGVELRSNNAAFNPIYPAEALIDGTPAPGLFGSSSHGLVGAEIIIDLPRTTNIHAIVIRQSQRRNRFNRARELEIEVDGRKQPTLTLQNLPGEPQKFPLRFTGRLIQLRVLSQYDDPETSVGGFDEIELLTHDNLEARFAPPAGFQPLDAPLIQDSAPVAAADSSQQQPPPPQAPARGPHPRTLWTQKSLNAATGAAKVDDAARQAVERHLARAAARAEHPLPPMPPVEDTAAFEAAHLDRAAETLELALAARLGGPSTHISRASRLLAAYYKDADDAAASAEAVAQPLPLQSLTLQSVWLMRMSMACDLMHARAPRRLGEQGRLVLKQVADDTLGRLKSARGDEAAIATAAIVVAATTLDDDQLYNAAIHGHDDMPGLMQLLSVMIDPHGVRNDSLQTVQPLLIESLVLAAECAANSGDDLYGHADGRLRKFLLNLSAMARPDGFLPPLAQQGEEPLPGLSDPALAILQNRFGNVRFSYYADYRLPGRRLDGLRILPWPLPRQNAPAASAANDDAISPSLTAAPAGAGAACVLPTARFAAVGVDGSSSDAGNWAALRVGNGRESDSDAADVLALDLFLGGLSPLPFNRANCSNSFIRRNWYERSLAHNGLVVDGRTAVTSRSQLELAGTSGKAAIIRGRSSDAWPGTTVDRTILLTGDYALDILAARASHEATFDLFYHGRGRPALSSRTEPRVDPLVGGPGYSLLRNLKTATTRSAYRSSWQLPGTDAVMTTYTAAPDEDALIVLAESPDVAQRRQIMIDRRKGMSADFATALEVNRPTRVRRVNWMEVTPNPPDMADESGDSSADDSGQAENADAADILPPGGARALHILMAGGSDYLLLADRNGRFSAGPVTTDARAAWVSTQPMTGPDSPDSSGVASASPTIAVRHILMAGGSFLQAFSMQVELSKPAMIAIEAVGGDDELLVHHLAGPAVNVIITRTGREALEIKLQPRQTAAVSSSPDKHLKQLAADRAARHAASAEALTKSHLETQRKTAELLERAADQPQDLPPIIIEAESFTGQQGGQVEITESKIGARGNKSFLHWNDEGHAIIYYFNVPQDGIYQVGMKYAAREDRTRRRIEFNPQGKQFQAIDVELPASGGWSNQRDDWLLAPLEEPATGQPWLVELKKGRHLLRMTALNRALNLDYIVLTPPGTQLQRAEFE